MSVPSDKFSSLPNEILGFILSKVPIREAVRSSVLSRRWRFLYTQIPQLKICPYLLLQGPVTPDPDPSSISTAENAISSILQSHCFDLEAFHLFNNTTGTRTYPIDNNWEFGRESVWKWVQYAADKNVQHLHLGYSRVKEIPPPALFFCTHLTTLTLNNFVLTHIPTHSSGFNHLISCSFTDMQLTDDSLSWFASHCPLLQKLQIFSCTGLNKPTISAPNILLLDVMVWDDIEVLTVNCPTIRIVELCLVHDLRVNGVFFHELSALIVTLEMQCEINVIGLKMDSTLIAEYGEYDSLSAQRFVEIVGSFKALKNLGIHIYDPLPEREKEMTFPLISLLQGLHHLEHLVINGVFLLELGRDKLPARLSPPLANLRYVMVELKEFDEREMDVLACLLKSAPALDDLHFDLPLKYEETQYTRFLEELVEPWRTTSSSCRWLHRILRRSQMRF
eukprot:PITA_11496